LVQGLIFQAFGNWIGTNQTLDLIIQADGGSTLQAPKNLVLDWAKGQPLAAVIENSLKAAYHDYTVNINISPNLILSEDAKGPYRTVEDFAAYINQISKTLITTPGYSGVIITTSGTTFNVFDGTSVSTTTPTTLAYTDLIGQPTWIDSPLVQFNTVMRADLTVGSQITFPTGLVFTTTAAAQTQFRDKSSFQGTFQISLARHVGAYRQPSADAWISTFNAYPVAA
jgi:hypothetical protein